MPMTRERRTGTRRFSLHEAAFATGLSRKAINQAIDREEIRPVPGRRKEDRERLLGFAELVYLCLRDDVGSLLSAEGKRRFYQQLARAVHHGEAPTAVTVGAIEVKVEPTVAPLNERIAELGRSHEWVVTDPLVRTGEPVVRGTRIPVQALAELTAQGAPREELLEDYPALTPEMLDAALLYARTHPRRGRPRRGAPWKDSDGGTA